MPRVRYSTELINELRVMVIEHNKAGHPAVKLGDLKKVYEDSYRGPVPRIIAMKKVQGHLRWLQKGADDQPRDAKGRFAETGAEARRGGGQSSLYRDVQRQADNERLKQDNAGYRDATTEVIPETRFTQLGVPAAGLAGLALGGVQGWKSRFGKPGMRPNALDAAAGVTQAMSFGQAKTTVRRLREAAPDWGRAASYTLHAPSSLINAITDRAAARRGGGGAQGRAARARQQLKAKLPGRLAAAAAGAGVAGYALYAPAAMAAAGFFGPIADSWKGGRRIEKAAAIARGPALPMAKAAVEAGGYGQDELMQKARGIGERLVGSAFNSARGSISGGLARATSSMSAGLGRLRAAMRPAAPPSGLNEFAARRMGRGMTGAGARRAAIGLAGVGGAAAAGGAALGATSLANRVYYRDEDGRFTSRDKAVITGVAGAAGALAAIGGARAALGRVVRERIARAGNAPMAPYAGRQWSPSTVGGEAFTPGRWSQISEDGVRSQRVNASVDNATETLARRLENADARRAVGLGGDNAPDVAAAVGAFDGVRTKLLTAFEREAAARYTGTTLTGRQAQELRLAQGQIASLYSGVTRSRDGVLFSAVDGKAFRDKIAKATKAAEKAKQRANLALQDFSLAPKRIADKAAAAEQGVEEWGKNWLRRERGKALSGKKDPAARQAIIAEFDAAERELVGNVAQMRASATGASAAMDAAQAARNTIADDVTAIRTRIQELSTSKPRKGGPSKAEIDAEIAKQNRLLARREKALEAANQKAIDAQAESNKFADVAFEGEAAVNAMATQRAGLKEQMDRLRARNPITGEYGPGLPTKVQLQVETIEWGNREAEKALRAIDVLFDTETKRVFDVVAARGKIIEDTAAQVRRATGKPPSGPAMQRIEEMATSVARFSTDVSRNLRQVGGSARELMDRRFGATAAQSAAYARQAAVKMKEYAGNTWNWAKTNKGKLIFGGGALGIIDVAADGKLNLNMRRVAELAENPTTALKDIQKRSTPFFRFFPDPNDPSKGITVTGLVYQKGSEPPMFISGQVERADGTKQDITTGANVSAVIGPLDRSKQQGGGDQQRGIGGNDEAEARSVAGKLQGAGGVRTNEIGGEKIFTPDASKAPDQGAYGRAVNALQQALSKDGADIGKNPSAKADQVFSRLGTMFGQAGNILTMKQKANILNGQNGILGVGGANIDTRAKLEAALEQLIDRAPRPQTDEQARNLRRAVRVLGTHGHSDQVKITEFDDLDLSINNRMNKVAPPAPAAAPSQAASSPSPGPAAAAQPARKDRADFDEDDWVGQINRDSHTRLRNAAQRERGQYRGAPPDSVLALQSKADMSRDDATAMIRSLYRANLQMVERNNPGDRPAERQRLAAAITRRDWLAGVDNVPNVALFDDEITKAAPARLRKADAPPPTAAQRRQWDETRVRRHTKGNEDGGEFAPKGGGGGAAAGRGDAPRRDAPPQRQAPRDRQDPNAERSYWEPVRLGGTVGGAVGASAAMEMFNRYVPKTFMAGRPISRFAVSMLASVVGGVAGQQAGEAAGAKAYGAAGRAAPPGWVPPDRPAEEEIGRTAGGVLGAFAGMAARTLPGGVALGTAGQLGGEELLGAAARIARERFGLQL